MGLGGTPSTMIDWYQDEIGDAASASTANDTIVLRLLNRVQRQLAGDYDWNHLKKVADVSGVAGTRLYTLPTTTLNFDRPVQVYVKHNVTYLPLEYDVDIMEMNLYDSDASESSSPVQRWRRYSTTQFEVWPIPSEAQTIRFVGQATFDDMVIDTTKSTLDDLLIVLTAAATTCARFGTKDAADVARRAAERMVMLRRVESKRKPIIELAPREEKERRKFVKVIAI